MASGTLNQYIQCVERMFRTANGDNLARLLSLRDDHIYNKNLRSSDIVSHVEGNCVAPLDEIIIYHLSCLQVNAFVFAQLIFKIFIFKIT